MAEIRDTAAVTGDNPVLTEIAALAAKLADPDYVERQLTDADHVDAIRALEDLKSSVAAAQARHTVMLDEAVRAHHARLKLPKAQHGRGVAQQVASARRESPFRGGMHLGMAKALVAEMPHTL